MQLRRYVWIDFSALNILSSEFRGIRAYTLYTLCWAPTAPTHMSMSIQRQLPIGDQDREKRDVYIHISHRIQSVDLCGDAVDTIVWGHPPFRFNFQPSWYICTLRFVLHEKWTKKKVFCILQRLIHLNDYTKRLTPRLPVLWIRLVCLPFLCVSTAVIRCARALVFFRHERIRAYHSAQSLCTTPHSSSIKVKETIFCYWLLLRLLLISIGHMISVDYAFVLVLLWGETKY